MQRHLNRAGTRALGLEFLDIDDPLTVPLFLEQAGIHLRRDSLSSITYSEELISATISATLQSTDRHDGIVGQERCHFQRDS